MKLRNKNTGEIAEIKLKLNEILPDAIRRTIKESGWEECREPLIKDKKIRKAVRAWAEAWNKNTLYKDADNVLSTIDNFVIQFGQTAFVDLEEKKSYTIAELCGEEEE